MLNDDAWSRGDMPSSNAETEQSDSEGGIDFQETVDNVVVGAHAQIHNHNYNLSMQQWFQITKFFQNMDATRSTAPADEGFAPAQQDPLIQKLSENYASDMEDTTYIGEGELREDAGAKAVPQTIAELTVWYFGLTTYERCFVMTVAVFHGMQTQEIARLAGEVYTAYRGTQVPLSPATEDASQVANMPTERISSMELQAHTHTTIRRVRDARRLFFQDTDSQGLSVFSMKVLSLITEEASMALNQSEENFFIEQLEQWPGRLKGGEASSRAARALGIVHWQQSVDQVRRRANTWADSEQPRERQYAASYMVGIYEAAPYMQEQQSDDPRKSITWLLDQWVERTHTTTNTRVGNAAVRTYGLMVKRDPEATLRGLNRLLYFVDEDIAANGRVLSAETFNEGVSRYVSLIWFGHIRLVLQQLATQVGRFVFPYFRTLRIPETVEQSTPPLMRLMALSDIFNFVCAASLSASAIQMYPRYDFTQPLPEQPRVPDSQGKDILLAGILTAGEPEWRVYLQTLLTGLILMGQAESAFRVMRAWLETVVQEQMPDQQEAQHRLITFIVSVGHQVYQLCHEGVRPGYRPAPMANLFKQELTRWQVEGRRKRQPIEPVAQEILSKLSF